MAQISHQIEHRVLYADTDAMGVIYYANYLRIYEAGRSDFMRKIGCPNKKMTESGIVCPAISVNIEYLKFAKFDQNIKVVTSVKNKPITKLEFIQEMFDEENNLLNKAIITLVFVNTKTNKATRCPDWLLKLFEKL